MYNFRTLNIKRALYRKLIYIKWFILWYYRI